MEPVVAIIPWTLIYEDWLEAHGFSLETFASKMNSGWLFGYIEALQRAGARAVVVCVSRTVQKPTRLRHRASGTPIVALPAPALYRRAGRKIRDPHGRRAEQMFGELRGVCRLGRAPLAALTEVAPYLATPVLLLARLLRQEGCQAILCQEYEFPRFDVCALVSIATGIPLFATFQGGNYQRWRLERLTRPLAVRSCRGLIIASASEIERVEQRYSISREKLAQIFNPVDVDLWCPGDARAGRSLLGIPETARVAVWHGRLELHKKGLDILLEAWAQLSRSRDPERLRLVLVGDGPDSERVQTLIRQLQLSNVALVDRYVNDPEEIRTYLASGDFYAFPSRHEGMAVAPLEGMACGLPLVAADVSGIRETLPDGERSGGIVVPPDQPEAFAAALARLLDNEQLRRELGSRARQRTIDRFSLAAVGRELRDFLFEQPRSPR